MSTRCLIRSKYPMGTPIQGREFIYQTEDEYIGASQPVA